MQKVQGLYPFIDPLAQVINLCLQTSATCPPGVPCQRKRSPEGDMLNQLSAKRVVTCALTGSEGTLEAASVTSSALVESGGAVAVKWSPPMCEGEPCQVSSLR